LVDDGAGALVGCGADALARRWLAGKVI